jgi:hypothetical protein
MTLLYMMLEALVNLLSHAGFWLVVWVVVLVGLSVCSFRKARLPKTSRRWVVRKGECPFCGNALFGTTRHYQRVYVLETLSPESQYLCTGCDQEKVAGLLSLLEDGR